MNTTTTNTTKTRISELHTRFHIGMTYKITGRWTTNTYTIEDIITYENGERWAVVKGGITNQTSRRKITSVPAKHVAWVLTSAGFCAATCPASTTLEVLNAENYTDAPSTQLYSTYPKC